ncbi:MCP methyltransferase, CheR-type [Syntrophobotulus glycolicus DSM 8271]|uniref:protein-glutamate O-methyltransferase n=1 Tax=Syntrophobotulus glycolicus (strain DSM 8271 / FlGlyR) TaxID=645991 RepID=F0SUK2_SYNGF|nr:protein-glutamate O-methyltransferase CheR [Syntrophobotulus glycolicus]ADY55495.1 MCP methyltransferase, CheR-type [Syntrophobotulus glycolicus DSM 8271]
MIGIKEREFREFADYIKTNYGIHFKDEKKTLIEGRLGQVLANLNLASLTEYMDYVAADQSGQAADLMLDKITTNHTFFMREPAHFEYFRETVLPYLIRAVRDRDLRIWSAACSSGEEPYTLAMILDEFFGPHKTGWDTKILATDISQGILAAAQAGVYSREKMEGLPESWKRRYFKEDRAGQYLLAEKIRKEVIFSRINLMDPVFPFRKKMHVIFCRNVMIYFDQETKDRLAERFYEITEPGGFLFIGHSEGLDREKTRYRYVMPAVYRKE